MITKERQKVIAPLLKDAVKLFNNLNLSSAKFIKHLREAGVKDDVIVELLKGVKAIV